MTQPANFGITNATVTLRDRLKTGGVLVIGGFGLSQLLRLASNLILTRLLMPEVFGLMAAAISISVLAIMITDIGIHSSVVRSEHAEKNEFLWTAWTMKIIRNMVVWGIVLLGALLVAYFASIGVTPEGSVFSDPLLPWVMAISSSQLGISAFESINGSLAARKLMMGRRVFHEVSTQVFTSIVTISAAFAGYGVWAFVTGIVVGAFFSLAISFVIYPGPGMRFRLDKEHFSEIFGFGKWLILASFFGFMTNKGDHFIFGWVMDDVQFGLYAIAAIWIMMAFHLFELASNKLFYPAISEVIRERPQNLTKAYRTGRKFLDAGAVMVAFGIYFFSDFALSILYPEGFTGISYYLKLLSPIVIFAPYRMLNYVILSKGESKRFTLITFSTGLAMLILAPLFILLFGIPAGVVVFACVSGVSLPIAWRIASGIMPLDWRAEGRLLIAAAVLVVLVLGVEPPAA